MVKQIEIKNKYNLDIGGNNYEKVRMCSMWI